LLDDDTIRTWHRLYLEDGIDGLASFGYEGGAYRLSDERRDRLKAWISETLPRTTREVGAWIEKECAIAYQGQSGRIALLHRIGMEHRKPRTVSRKLDPAKQAAFIKTYEELLNHLAADEAVLFADAVHPTHAVRPVGCWGPKDTKVAVAQTSGRQRLNIHGAIDLETGKTRMLEAATVDAASTIMLLMAIEAMYPGKRVIHLFADNE
jgi:transposase